MQRAVIACGLFISFSIRSLYHFYFFKVSNTTDTLISLDVRKLLLEVAYAHFMRKSLSGIDFCAMLLAIIVGLTSKLNDPDVTSTYILYYGT
jgi:hypothetical protein